MPQADAGTITDQQPPPFWYQCDRCDGVSSKHGPFDTKEAAEAYHREHQAAHDTEHENRVAVRVQKFFDDYRVQIQRPHYGPLHRDVVKEMLLRAQEAQLYTPPKE